MANWLRLILSVLALVGLLAAGTSGAFAKSAHQCCPEASTSVTMDDHAAGGGDNHALPDCCVFGACAVVAPVAPPMAHAATPAVFAKTLAFAADDSGPPSRSPSPDLRPPIA
jgi:hypothetical protein